MLITLVNSHYELSFTAQNRNLDDPATIAEFAGIVGNRPTSTPSCCSPWPTAWAPATKTGPIGRKASSGPSTAAPRLSRRRTDHLAQLSKNREDLCGSSSGGLAQAISRGNRGPLPSHAGAIFPNVRRRANRRTCAPLPPVPRDPPDRDDPPALRARLQWIAPAREGHSEVWVCGWDRPRLLERIAGAFLSAQINILSADIFTRGDNLALDIFRVCSTQLTPVTNVRVTSPGSKPACDSLAVEDYDFTPLLSKDARLRTYRISQDARSPHQDHRR